MKKINLGIRSKILLYFGGLLIIIILALYFAISAVVFSGFEHIESYYGQNNVMRVTKAIDSDSMNLQSICEDYAVWGSTYDFVKGLNPSYPEVDAQDDSLITLGINYLIITDTSNNIILFKHYDGERFSDTPSVEELNYLNSQKKFFVHSYSNDAVKGIVKFSAGPIIFAASNILKSDGSGESAGSLIMIRNIDETYIDKISVLTGLNVKMMPYETFNNNSFNNSTMLTGMITGRLIATPELAQDVEKYPFKVIDEKNSLSYTVVDDMDGMPLFVIAVLSTREVYAQAKSMMSLFLIFLIIIFLVSYVILYILIYQTMLSRISHMHKEIHELVEKDNYSGRISVLGNDELSSLAVSFNTTLDGLESANLERNIIFDAHPDTLLMIDSSGKIITKKVSESLRSASTGVVQSDKSHGDVNMLLDATKIFSESNIDDLRLAALASIKEYSSKMLEFKEDVGEQSKYYEARIHPYKKESLVLIRDITEIKMEQNLLKIKNEELENFSAIAVDRELKMIELKKEIAELKNRLNSGIKND